MPFMRNWHKWQKILKNKFFIFVMINLSFEHCGVGEYVGL